MKNNIIEYSFSKLNKKTVIFVPGYTGGLENPTIKETRDYFIKQNKYNVFGIILNYVDDTQDEFDNSQRNLITAVREIASKSTGTEVILLAKSLGGSLSLFNYHKLPVSKIILLGCSIVLGWPQRISLLNSKNPTIPDYKKEWEEILEGLSNPVLIIAGMSDDLSDNKYLFEMSNKNPSLHIAAIKNSNHNLEDIKTSEFKFADVMANIFQFIEI